MPNNLLDQNLFFDTELSLSAAFTGVPQLVGTLTSNPVMILFKNQSDVTVFIADNAGSTAGMTMVAGESIIMDLRANRGSAATATFRIGTKFYLTGTAGTGDFKISVLYVK